MKTKSASPESGPPATAPLKIPALNTWWVRTCNQKRYFLRRVHELCGQTYVWIYQEGVNRCYHLPLTTLLQRYRQLPVGPVDPATGNTFNHLN
jgi:hypothetical protein